ncbi:hypothetical protein B0H17DRAFT_1062270, partial [Mycena rosella]
MKLSISALVSIAIAIAAPASAAFVSRVEGEIPDATSAMWLSIEQGITYKNSTALAARAGTEVVSCYGFGTKADRAPIVSVIDDFCGKVIGTNVQNGQTVWVSHNSRLITSSHSTTRPGTTMGPSPFMSVSKPSMAATSS